ncbi:hypothetical protein MH117_20055 [Paenibacillus sp. ACRRX]|uniref:hypothetical protein n=1 Tax=Paenibacillus sp. ACRRX TaxID=2918206 RepID=UPI001EF4AE5E|nr:hypothetical protein [Paenibacillus sp. ACRRX]MCG7409703.1 hypothetical protein [Paenibacillus sp. ACRRX]
MQWAEFESILIAGKVLPSAANEKEMCYRYLSVSETENNKRCCKRKGEAARSTVNLAEEAVPTTNCARGEVAPHELLTEE